MFIYVCTKPKNDKDFFPTRNAIEMSVFYLISQKPTDILVS
jgi:hypothetical protein